MTTPNDHEAKPTGNPTAAAALAARHLTDRTIAPYDHGYDDAAADQMREEMREAERVQLERLTNDQLAWRLTAMADQPGRWSPIEAYALLHTVATRLWACTGLHS